MERIYLILLMILNFSLSAIIELTGFSIHFAYLILLGILSILFVYFLLIGKIQITITKKLTLDKLFYFIFTISLFFTVLNIQTVNDKVEYAILFICIPVFLLFLSKELITRNIGQLPIIMLLGALPNFLVLILSNKITDSIIILYGDIIFTSRIFGFITILSVYLLFKYKKYFLIYATLAITSLYVVFQSGARQVFLAMFISLVFLVVINININLLKKYFIRFLVLVMIGSLFFLIFKDSFKEFYLVQRWILQGADSSGRDILLELSIEQFFSSSMKEVFLGIGLGLYQLAIGNIIFFYPHNIFLEFLIECGIFVCIVFIFYCLGIIVEYSKSKRYYFKSETAILFYIFLYFLVVANFSANITSNSFLFIMMAVLTICYSYKTPFTKEV